MRKNERGEGSYGILGFIIGIMLIMFLGAMMGFDGCTCGYGPEIRRSVKNVFQSKAKPAPVPVQDSLLDKPVKVAEPVADKK